MKKIHFICVMALAMVSQTMWAQFHQDTIGPLLGEINYNQGTPYNNYCPILAGDQNRRSVTGCVATAMAQVMRYYRYPACGVGEAIYTSSNGAATFYFAEHPFDWNNMLEDYESQHYNSTQADAVADLMLACGASINMMYSADGSGTFCDKAHIALKNTFGYSSAMYVEARGNELENLLEYDWQYTMMENLDNGWPVIFAGTAKSGGHCFVVDGYTVDADDNAWFHINWGWGGIGNNWCRIHNFSNEPSDNYTSFDARMVYNIHPDNWTAVENVEGQQFGFNPNAPVYNLLGMRIENDRMIHGQIYVQQGVKFIW